MRTALTIATVLTIGTAIIGGMTASLVLWILAPFVGIILGLMMVIFKWK